MAIWNIPSAQYALSNATNNGTPPPIQTHFCQEICFLGCGNLSANNAQSNPIFMQNRPNFPITGERFIRAYLCEPPYYPASLPFLVHYF